MPLISSSPCATITHFDAKKNKEKRQGTSKKCTNRIELCKEMRIFTQIICVTQLKFVTLQPLNALLVRWHTKKSIFINILKKIIMSEIESKVKEIIVDKLGVDEAEVKPEASFTNDLGADSLDTVELIMEFEKEFGVSIPDDTAEKIGTVGDAIAYIEKNKK